MSLKNIKEFAMADFQDRKLIEMDTKKLCLSARAYYKIFEISRTIAHLTGTDDISADHIAKAIPYRS